MNGSAGQRLLEIQVETLFVTSRSGRILHCAGPDRAPAPRLHLAIGAGGAIVRVRDDIAPRIADAIEALATREFSVTQASATPRFSEEYRQLLDLSEPLTDHHFGVIHQLPHQTRWNGGATVVCHGTRQGDALIAKIAREGMPQDLVEAGFVDLSHFWEPWCVATVDDKIASLAFAVRLGEQGAELGVNTLPAYRGQGLAAAVTAGWSTLPTLQRRPLFYATHRDNLSSQRVIARLGLPFLGIRLQI
ncbi:MAG TPA: hypothetical protein VKT24_03065 [Rhizomicrobium sp.]|nr:hypothetical protein [Rhizomicrobium sp.]